MSIEELFGIVPSWIESHEHTVDLFKWSLAGITAWTLGIFRAIREWTRRPTVLVNPAYSSCYLEQHSFLGEHTDVSLLVFIIDVGVLNPTATKLGVRSFDLRVERTGVFRQWTSPASAIGFPDMPRTPMPGGNEKVVPIWLTKFEGYNESLSLSEVEGQHSSAGLTFFSVAIDSARLKTNPSGQVIKLRVTLGSGEKRSVKSVIKVRKDFDHLERRVPKSIDYVRHKSVWQHCV